MTPDSLPPDFSALADEVRRIEPQVVGVSTRTKAHKTVLLIVLADATRERVVGLGDALRAFRRKAERAKERAALRITPVICSPALCGVRLADRAHAGRRGRRYSALSQPVEEREEGVAGSEARPAWRRVLDASERGFLHGEVGFDVAVGRLRTLVAEPERDDGEGDAGLEEMHRCRVPHGVG